jgi:hypothetical protein
MLFHRVMKQVSCYVDKTYEDVCEGRVQILEKGINMSQGKLHGYEREDFIMEDEITWIKSRCGRYEMPTKHLL